MMTKRTPIFIDLPGQGFVAAGRLDVQCGPDNVESAIFSYDPGYLARADAMAMDPVRLPLPTDGATTHQLATQGELVSAVRDASPDGFGRLVLSRACGDRSLDEFDYLVGSGTRRVGALAFGSDLLVPDIDLDQAVAGFNAFEGGDNESSAFRAFVDAATSLGGARPKAAVVLDNRHWLAKFPKADDGYDAIGVEAGVMRLAAEAGFDVPEVRIARSGDRHVFLVERFDRQVAPDGSISGRTPFLSAMSATGHTEITARYGSYEEIADACRAFGAHADLRDLFRRAVFNVLTGNDDDHLRNHGFLYDRAAATWRLSPLYDVAPRPQTSSVRKLAIAMGKDDPDRPSSLGHVTDAAAAFDLSHEEALAICEDLRAFVAANWERQLKDAGVTDRGISLVSGCFASAEPGIAFVGKP